MRFKLCLWCLLFLALVNLAMAEASIENTIIYTVVEDSVIVDQKITFSEMQQGIEIMIPYDSEAIEVKNQDFEIIEEDGHKIIYVEGPEDYLHIKYISDSYIENTKDYFFLVNLAPIEGSKDITLELPEFASLKYSIGSENSAVIPSTDDISSDGKRIILHWDGSSLENSNSLLVIYNMPSKNNVLAYLMIIVIIIFLGIMISYLLLKKGKTEAEKVEAKIESNNMTRNLFEEEKAIVEVLLKAPGHEVWQKQLIYETGISKVKLSRKLRALESKGLVEKVPFGNTNKIRLKQ